MYIQVDIFSPFSKGIVFDGIYISRKYLYRIEHYFSKQKFLTLHHIEALYTDHHRP